MAKEKVLVGISGGVDSAVAMYILQRAGYAVTALTLITYENENQKKDLIDAKLICKKLKVKHIIKDVQKEFKKEVIDYFVSEYKNGRTPNPCCKCNKDIKMKYLLDTAKELKYDYFATGHYARRCKVNNNRFAIKVASCEAKDQAYMLYKLSQDQIQHLLLPLSYLEKEDVRNIAKFIGLNIYNKKDSLDVCFIKDIDYKEFIKRYSFGKDYVEQIASGNKSLLSKMENSIFLKRGQFVDTNKNILGFHEGIINYTIGQRKGLNINLAKKAFVVDINPSTLEIMLGDKEDLLKKEMLVEDVNFQAINDLQDGEELKNIFCKIRYKDEGEYCNIKKVRDLLKVNFKKPVYSVTSGQSAVFYYKDVILCGGTII